MKRMKKETICDILTTLAKAHNDGISDCIPSDFYYYAFEIVASSLKIDNTLSATCERSGDYITGFVLSEVTETKTFIVPVEEHINILIEKATYYNKLIHLSQTYFGDIEWEPLINDRLSAFGELVVKINSVSCKPFSYIKYCLNDLGYVETIEIDGQYYNYNYMEGKFE